MSSKEVFQDGPDFYFSDRRVSAPVAVNDFDNAAAAEARDWFVRVWCPANGIEPLFI